jgi:hypothetical protein
MDLEGSNTSFTTTKVVFGAGATGQLMLGNSAHFDGTVAGFLAGSSIDVTDVAFVAGKNFYDPQTGNLNLSDGVHAASIQLLGQYTPSQFTFASDGHGGTLITDPPPFLASHH